AGKFFSRNAGGKTQIVFNLGTCAGLAAGRVRFDDEHVKSLRRSIYCCGQTGRSRADYYHVAHMRAIDALVEAETVDDLMIAGITQYHAASTNQNRQVTNRHAKAIQ